jgi:hypothetical protein
MLMCQEYSGTEARIPCNTRNQHIGACFALAPHAARIYLGFRKLIKVWKPVSKVPRHSKGRLCIIMEPGLRQLRLAAWGEGHWWFRGCEEGLCCFLCLLEIGCSEEYAH